MSRFEKHTQAHKKYKHKKIWISLFFFLLILAINSTYSDNEFNRTEWVKSTCSAGYYRYGRYCYRCPNGSYCPTGNSDPIPCPAGTFSYEIGSSGITRCQTCKYGYYADKPGSSECKQCPNGSFCCDPRIPPTLCPAGTFSYEIGSSGITRCYPCGENFTSKENSFFCYKCAKDSACPSFDGDLSCNRPVIETESNQTTVKTTPILTTPIMTSTVKRKYGSFHWLFFIV